MKKLALVTALLLSTSSQVQASTEISNVKWNSINLSHQTLKFDDLDDLKPAGFNLSGTKLITDNIFLGVGYGSMKDNFDRSFYDVQVNTELELSGYTFGAGYRHPLTANTDLYASVSLSKEKMEITSTVQNYGSESESIDADGTSFSVGVVSNITDSVQVNAAYGTTNTEVQGEDDSVSGFRASLSYFLTSEFALTASYSNVEDSSTTGFGASYYF